MLRDNLAGLIDPMRAARELNLLALFIEQKKSSDDRPQDALKIPAPKGRNRTLTENAAFPFHAEPRKDHVSLPGTILFRLENRYKSLSFRNAIFPAHSPIHRLRDKGVRKNSFRIEWPTTR